MMTTQLQPGDDIQHCHGLRGKLVKTTKRNGFWRDALTGELHKSPLSELYYCPSPETIERQTAELQATWSERQEKKANQLPNPDVCFEAIGTTDSRKPFTWE